MLLNAIVIFICSMFIFSVNGAFAQVQWQTKMSFDHILFLENPYSSHHYNDQQSSVSLSSDMYGSFFGSDISYRFEGFYRYDEKDKIRSHADIRHLYARYEQSNWALTLGIDKVFWGVVESRHLVDVINQADFLEDVDLEDKLGQPMLTVTHFSPEGELSLFLLPKFRELQFYGQDSRFRTSQVIDVSQSLYESSAADQHLDWALRYTHVLGSYDIGVSYFDGTTREPRLVDLSESGNLVPVYDLMRQVGLDLQYTGDSTLLKMEAIYRDTRIDSFFAGVFGVEHTLYQMFGSALDCGLMVEYLFDERNPLSSPTSFDNDLFLGTRLALNDLHDTQLIAGVIVDADHGQTFVNIEGTTRLMAQLVAELDVRILSHANVRDPMFSFSQDDHFRLTLSWYF